MGRKKEKKKKMQRENVRRGAFSLALGHKEGGGNSKDSDDDDDKVLVVGIGESGARAGSSMRGGGEEANSGDYIRSKPRC